MPAADLVAGVFLRKTYSAIFPDILQSVCLRRGSFWLSVDTPDFL
jgi:hypothetical protein